MILDFGRWYFGVQWAGGRKWLYPFNWIPRPARYWGYMEEFYDGPLPTFGLWYFNVSWCW